MAFTNAHGFRGEDLPRKKSPGQLRIACLGDSFTFGWGVNDDETWPARLEVELGERGIDAEVMNFGVEGYHTVQEVALLEHRALRFDPDLVLLGYYVNDVNVDPLPPVERGAMQNALLEALDQEDGGFVNALCSWSVLCEGVRYRVIRAAEGQAYLQRYRRAYADDGSGWIKVQRALVAARDLLERENVGFAVVLYPMLSGDAERLVTHEPYQAVLRFCRKQKIAVFDLEPAFLGQDLESLVLHPLDPHPNAAAHAIAAAHVGAASSVATCTPSPPLQAATAPLSAVGAPKTRFAELLPPMGVSVSPSASELPMQRPESTGGREVSRGAPSGSVASGLVASGRLASRGGGRPSAPASVGSPPGPVTEPTQPSSAESASASTERATTQS